MKKVIAMLMVLAVLLILCACGQDPATTGSQNMEGNPTAPTGTNNQKPTQAKPTNPKPTIPTPTEPPLCSHVFSNGICVKCGVLEPTEGVEYTLRGRVYAVTGMLEEPKEPYNLIIADSYNGLPVTIIEQGAFEEDAFLTEVVIPDTVESIGSNAFRKCTALKNVRIGAGVTRINDDTFASCEALDSIYIPESINYIAGAFDRCNISKVHIASIEAWCNIWFASTEGNPLSNGAALYLNDEKITELIIPEGVTTIGRVAFYGCSYITSVSIPNSVVSIGDNAFDKCDNLNCQVYDTAYYLGNSSNPYLFLKEVINTDIKSCEIHVDTKIIGSNAFNSCYNITSMLIPEGVHTIGGYAFQSCSWLRSIVIPKTVTTIGNGAFSMCNRIEKVSIESIEAWCAISFYSESSNPLGSTAHNVSDEFTTELFVNGTKVTELVIPAGVTSIGQYAFHKFTELTSVTIMEGLTEIGDSAFFGCSGLKDITIPNTVTNIDASAFWGCSSLTEVILPLGLKVISSNLFVNCVNLESVVLPAGLEEVYNDAFSGCEKLKSIMIPASVKRIWFNAFENCGNLTSVTISANIKEIGYNVFNGCHSLTVISFEGTMEQWDQISLGYSAWNDADWRTNSGITKIICSDGVIELE